jgi:hypothetical protein
MNAGGLVLLLVVSVAAGVHAQTFTEKAKLFSGDRKEIPNLAIQRH